MLFLAIGLAGFIVFRITTDKAKKPLQVTPAVASTKPAEDGKQITNSIGMKLVLIPAGKFMMGVPGQNDDKPPRDKSPGETVPLRSTDGEKCPQHEVEITKPFYMGVYAVTQAEYERVIGANPSAFSAKGQRSSQVWDTDTSRFPVESVSWEDAVEFCHKLSNLTEEKQAGRGYRLPTEAEWEYACRAGTTSTFHFGDQLSNKQANFNSYSIGALGRPTRVGCYPPNAFGLYDMHGNVLQWCQDWYDVNYYAFSPSKDPSGPDVALRNRVVRGGSCYDSEDDCASAHRGATDPTLKNLPKMNSGELVPWALKLKSVLGFRVVAVQAGR